MVVEHVLPDARNPVGVEIIDAGVNVERHDGQFELQVTIPANTTATVFVPVRPGGLVKEVDVPAEKSPGVKLLRTENGRAVYAVDSGEYHFKADF